MFEIVNSVGKLHIEVNAFERFYFVIVAYAGLLKLDGSMQVVHPTPYVPQSPYRTLIPPYSTSCQSASWLDRAFLND